jgi:hypothetical protein
VTTLQTLSFRSWSGMHLERVRTADGDEHYRFSCDKCGTDYRVQSEAEGMRSVGDHRCR